MVKKPESYVPEFYSPLKKAVWRFVRTAVASGFASASLVKFDLTDPKKAMGVLMTAFIAGVLEAITKYLREGKDYDAVVHKLPL